MSTSDIKVLTRERTDAETRETLVERAVGRIRQDIVAGLFEPDARLGIAALVDRYGIGATPIREALSRLSAAGLVRAIGNRGFRVPTMSRRDLEDIIKLRQLVECEALQRSMESGDDDWEAGIVGALHRLRKNFGSDHDAMRHDSLELDRLHKNFHAALISACGSRRMLELQDVLYDQALRYRVLMMRALPQPEAFGDEHSMLAELALSRDAEKATAALAVHLTLPLKAVYPEAMT